MQVAEVAVAIPIRLLGPTLLSQQQKGHAGLAEEMSQSEFSRPVQTVLDVHIADPRVRRIIEQGACQHEEMLLLAKHVGRRK